MEQTSKALRVIISGGGTGGHIFPALAIADCIRQREPNAEFLFVGANGRMEMTRVPAAGYSIVGLNISGFNRSNPWRNIALPFKMLQSHLKARRIIKDFRPDIVIGTGGYASYPVLRAAQQLGIPTVIQEQNSFAGKTNILLGKRAARVCVAYENMEKFFPSQVIRLTGNPSRGLPEGQFPFGKEYIANAIKSFHLPPNRKTVLITGGSLGAGTLNNAMLYGYKQLIAKGINVIWQTGKYYYTHIAEQVEEQEGLYLTEFLSDMYAAYAAADIVVSRAGAGAIAELCLLGKSAILIPSPNVTEDHQTKNAMALVEKQAAMMLPDVDVQNNPARLVNTIISALGDIHLSMFGDNALLLAKPNATDDIVTEILSICRSRSADDQPSDVQRLYFVGAGGIGMSNLVRYYLAKGKKVAGYDRTASHLTDELIKEGAQLHFDDDVALIPAEFLDPAGTLVVYTPAIPAEHKELNYFKLNGFTVIKRAALLGRVSRNTDSICVAGTHGKTTTSTMTAHILHSSHVGCNAFLGGISKNYHSNLLLSDTSPYSVIEADEYDRSFHQLTPQIAIVTSTDADHLDIYGTHDAYLESFAHFVSLIKPNGTLIYHISCLPKWQLSAGTRSFTYGRTQGDYHATNERIGGGRIIFDMVTPQGTIHDIELGVPISINIENSIAAAAAALSVGVTDNEVRAALASFQGIERRFDFRLRTATRALLMDYAHHPAEIAACITSLRELYPHPLTIAGVFQPHLYSRTRDFYEEFASALSALDYLVLTDIYPAREQPIDGVTSKLISEHTRCDMPVFHISKSDLPTQLPEEVRNANVLVLLGAGDIDTMIDEIMTTFVP